LLKRNDIMKLVLQVAAGVVLGGIVLWLLSVILGFSLIAAVIDRFGDKQLSVTLPKFSPSPSNSSASGSGWVDQQPRLGNILPARPQKPSIGSTKSPSRRPNTPPSAQQTRKVWVPGRPLEECLGPNKELNPEVLRCQQGYYKEERVAR
jgi:hypothetical protein